LSRDREGDGDSRFHREALHNRFDAMKKLEVLRLHANELSEEIIPPAEAGTDLKSRH